MSPEETKPPLLQLHVPAGIHDGSIQVQWCLTKAGRDELARLHVVEPWVLVVVAHADDSIPEERQLVKLSELATYVQFRAPGKNRILATVVWHLGGAGADTPRDIILARKKGRYESDVLNYGRTDFKSGLTIAFVSGVQVTVEVPKEVFSDDPFDLRWLTAMLDGPLTDDCAVRKRRFFAYTCQPIAFAVIFLGVFGIFYPIGCLFNLILAFFILLAGGRGMNFHLLLDPAGQDELLNSVKGNLFMPKVGRHRLSFLFAFAPIVDLPVLALCAATGHHHHWPFGTTVLVAGEIVLCFAALGGLVQLFANLPVIARAIKRFWTRLETKSRLGQPTAWYEDPERADALVCEDTPVGMSLRKKAPMTLRLRFLGVKSKVCAPLSYRPR